MHPFKKGKLHNTLFEAYKKGASAPLPVFPSPFQLNPNNPLGRVRRSRRSTRKHHATRQPGKARCRMASNSASMGIDGSLSWRRYFLGRPASADPASYASVLRGVHARTNDSCRQVPADWRAGAWRYGDGLARRGAPDAAFARRDQAAGRRDRALTPKRSSAFCAKRRRRLRCAVRTWCKCSTTARTKASRSSRWSCSRVNRSARACGA